MSIDHLIGTWKEVRGGLIDEVAQIPPDQFSFRATPETRSVSELLQHVIETQKTGRRSRQRRDEPDAAIAQRTCQGIRP